MTAYLKSSLQNLYKTLLNAIDGPEFNRSAHEESRNSTLKYHDPESGPHEDWEHITMQTRLRAESSEGDFMIDEEPGIVSKAVTKFSEKALESAAEAAGHSKAYTLLATRYILTEMARDVGWVMNCQTAAEALQNLHRRFPFLIDLKRAYEEGARGIEAGGVRREMTRIRGPVEGWNHPRDVDVESNLDDLAIMGDEDVRGDVASREGRMLVVEKEVSRGRRRMRD